MDEKTKKTFFINAVVMAKADGAIDPVEKKFIRKLMDKAEISGNQANEWLAEARKNEYRVLPVTNQDDITKLLKLMIGVAAIDDKFKSQEKEILIQIGKANGLSQKELVDLIKGNWNRNVIEDIFEPARPIVTQIFPVAIITNDFDMLDNFINVNTDITFKKLTMTEIASENPPDFVVFHTAENKEDSLNRLRKIQNIFPKARTIAVVKRDQAFQVSYILDHGAFRCMVKPIYPNELRERIIKTENRT